MWVSLVYMDADVFWRTYHMVKAPICLLMWVSECKVSSLGDICSLWGYDLKWSYIQNGNCLSLVVSGVNLMFPGKRGLWYVWVFSASLLFLKMYHSCLWYTSQILALDRWQLHTCYGLNMNYFTQAHVLNPWSPVGISIWRGRLWGRDGLGSWILAGVSRSLRHGFKGTRD